VISDRADRRQPIIDADILSDRLDDACVRDVGYVMLERLNVNSLKNKRVNDTRQVYDVIEAYDTI